MRASIHQTCSSTSKNSTTWSQLKPPSLFPRTTSCTLGPKYKRFSTFLQQLARLIFHKILFPCLKTHPQASINSQEPSKLIQVSKKSKQSGISQTSWIRHGHISKKHIQECKWWFAVFAALNRRFSWSLLCSTWWPMRVASSSVMDGVRSVWNSSFADKVNFQIFMSIKKPLSYQFHVLPTSNCYLRI